MNACSDGSCSGGGGRALDLCPVPSCPGDVAGGDGWRGGVVVAVSVVVVAHCDTVRALAVLCTL